MPVSRLRVYDIRTSRLWRAVGLCQGDIQQICDFINSAQERLVTSVESGEEGWWGSWAEMVFEVTRDDPFFVAPLGVARVIDPAVCGYPVGLKNQFAQYMQFGSGPRSIKRNLGPLLEVMDKGLTATTKELDISKGPQFIRVYPTSEADLGQRVLIQGEDANGIVVRTQDGYDMVNGIFVTLDSPFVDAPIQFTKINGLQKDQTTDSVTIRQSDPESGEEVTLVTLAANEQVSGYRRYQVLNVPCNCCGCGNPTCNGCNDPNPPAPIQVSAIVKLDLLPCYVDTDYLLIQSREAIIAECQSIRYSEQDGQEARAQERLKHKEAIRYLNGQLTHEMGEVHPSIQFRPFGSADLNRVRIGMV